MKTNEIRVVKEGIKLNGELLNFGNYTVKETEKLKVKISVKDDEYAVKTYRDATRLEKNGRLLIESVPGASFFNFKQDEHITSFTAFGKEDAQITLELNENTEYQLIVDEKTVGKLKSNISGKVNFSLDFAAGGRNVRIEAE